jgi:hypothetical protein
VVLLLSIGTGLRVYNLLAFDPFIDEVNWVNAAVEHVYDTADYTNPAVMPAVLRTEVAPKLVGAPGPLLALAREFDDWQTRSPLWFPIAIYARPPLFFWLTLVTTKLPANPVIDARLAAVIPNILGGCLLYAMALRAYSRTVALIVGLLWIASPFALMNARIAADDALLCFFSIGTALTTLLTMRSEKRVWPVLLGVMLAAGIYTKTLGLLNAIVPLLGLAILVPASGWAGKARSLVIAYVVAALLVAPLLPLGPPAVRAGESVRGCWSHARGREPVRICARSSMAHGQLWASAAMGYRLLQVAVPTCHLCWGGLGHHSARSNRTVSGRHFAGDFRGPSRSGDRVVQPILHAYNVPGVRAGRSGAGAAL